MPTAPKRICAQPGCRALVERGRCPRHAAQHAAREVERRRRLREEELARQHQAMREAALRTAEEQGVEVELSVEDRARMEMQENAANMAREHPEDVAQLIRTWLVEE